MTCRSKLRRGQPCRARGR